MGISVNCKQMKRSDIPKAIRDKVKERSEGLCERTFYEVNGELVETRCGREACDMHHILSRSQGGGHTVENLIHLCRMDHNFCKEHPLKAIRVHLVIPYKGFVYE